MMKRREFLKTGIGIAGSVMLPWRGFVPDSQASSSEISRVWMADGSPQEAAAKLVEGIGGIGKYLPEGGSVLIKPNIAFPAPPQWGVTTDPEFLAAIIDICLQGGARRVMIIDHPVGASPDKNLKRSGIGEVCEARDKVKVVMADDVKHFRPCTIEKGKTLKETMVAKILDKVDLFINMPTAKHHSATGVSLGLKNFMGLIWDRVPFHEEIDLDQGIADLATVIHPQLTFLDGRYALLSNGPTGPGQVEEVGKYLAGFDPLAVDAIGVELASWQGRLQKGSNIPHLVKAHELGVGEIERERIEVVELMEG
jgi:uncharacterized protein (DUF362 family)